MILTRGKCSVCGRHSDGVMIDIDNISVVLCLLCISDLVNFASNNAPTGYDDNYDDYDDEDCDDIKEV